MKQPTYEETQELLRAPWKEGFLTRNFSYKGDHPKGEKVLWRTYHNDTDYISVRLLREDGTAIIEFTDVPDLVMDSRLGQLTEE